MRLPKRFWDKVFINEWEPQACWLWTGRKMKGYGEFGTHLAHRLVFLEFGGTLTPEKSWVLHKCHEFGHKDNPACVNPNHLKSGNRTENNQDRVINGTSHINGNSIKTHCLKGHEFDLLNTRYCNEKRYCIACQKRRDANRETRRRK